MSAYIPEFSVTDFNRSINFYVNTIGFKIEYQREEKMFAFLSLGNSQIMIEQINEYWKTGDPLEYPLGRGINFQFEVEEIQPLIEILEKGNYPIFVPPEDNWYRVEGREWGSREFLVLDPDGYMLRFSEDLGYKDL